MTIAPDNRIEIISATLGQTILDTGYRVDLKEYLVVKRRRAGVLATLVADVDYGVTNIGNPLGARVTLGVGALAGDVYALIGGLPVGRSSSFVQEGGITPASLDAELDRFQMQLQEMRRDVDAAIRVDPTLGLAPQIPDPVGGRFLAWNDDGTALENRNGSAPVLRGEWLPVVEYSALDIVRRNGSSYIGRVGHQSTFATEPGAGSDWADVWELLAGKGNPGEDGLPGPGTGDMLKAENLSGLANITTARDNLGLGALATLNTVDTSQINNDAVLYAKIQNVSATDRLLGRVSAGAGDIEEIVFTDYAQVLAAQTSEAGVKAYLNLEIGVDVQAYSPTLSTWATKTPPAGTVVGHTDAQTLTNKTISAASNTISALTLAMFAANVVDTDATLAANSNDRVSTQAAVKSYVDNAITGLKWKTAVACKTTGNITLSGEQTIDSVVTNASRVLVGSQSSAIENGIWVSASGAWSRAADADTGAELVAAAVLVTQGTVFQNTQWANSNSAITLGVTAISFAQMSGAGTYSAAGGLSLTGNQFSIAADGVTFAKMQNIATDSLIGRDTAGTGDPENITLNGTLEMDGAGALRRAALTGDVTAAAGSNATTIANDAVAFAKMQNIATDSLIGRDTAGTGDPENITLNATLEMDGAGALRRAALTGDVTAAAGANATSIAANAVTFAKFQQIATAKLLGRQTASTGNVEEVGVTGGVEFNGSGSLHVAAFTGDVTKNAGATTLAIAANAVTDAKLRDSAALSVIGRAANSSGDPADIAAGANDRVLRRVGNALDFGQLTVGMIPDALVTYAKIQNVSGPGKLLGRVTADPGAIEELSMSSYFYGLFDVVDAAALRSAAGAVIGTDVQAHSVRLAEIAALTLADGDTILWNGTTGHWEAGPGGGGSGAPTDVEYLVKTSSAGLSNERVVTDTGSIAWDWATGGQVKANVVGYGDLLTAVSLLALQIADNTNLALFPSEHRVADSFEDLTYVDVAGATALDTSAAGVLKPTLTGSSYANTGGQGDRSASITLSTNMTLEQGTLSNIIDGGTANNSSDSIVFNPSQTSGYIQFDFGSGNAKVITEVTWKQSGANSQGTWKFAGSNDGSNFTDLGGTFTLGSSATQVITEPALNTVPYRYYRLIHTTGATNNSAFCQEVEFKIASALTVNNLTVRSASFTAVSAPTRIKGLILCKELDAATAGTDYTFEVSRDGGTTWATATITELFTMPSPEASIRVVETDEVDVSGQPSGTSPRWRFKTLNNKLVELRAAHLYWN